MGMAWSLRRRQYLKIEGKCRAISRIRGDVLGVEVPEGINDTESVRLQEVTEERKSANMIIEMINTTVVRDDST